MIRRLMKTAVAVFVSAGMAGTASAELVAGWDFSQYNADGSLDSGAGSDDTLSANYSSFDATGGAGGTGPGDAPDFGTMYMDGSFGSTDVDETAAITDVLPEVVARAAFTEANRGAPLQPGTLPTAAFDEFSVLRGQGQVHTSYSGLVARDVANLVFQGTLPSSTTKEWTFSFAGFAIDPTGAVDVDVEFAADCGGYALVDTVTLTAAEQSFLVPVTASPITDNEACVRLRLDPTNGQPVIDNTAITVVPEPGLVALAAGGVLLVGLNRRRRA